MMDPLFGGSTNYGLIGFGISQGVGGRVPSLRNTPRAFLMMFRMPCINPGTNGRTGKMNESGCPTLRNKERSADKLISEFS